MKKVTIAHDMYIKGYGTIKADTVFRVVKFNSRYIYADVGPCCTLRLAYSDTTAKPPKRKSA